MANQGSSAFCSLPAYQTFMPLSGFPPAVGYCSTTSLPNQRREYDAAYMHTPRDFICPVGNTQLCDLLSQLKASNHDFAQGVWYVNAGQHPN